MKYSLKSVKTLGSASQDSLCFSASLYADNVKIADVSNDGWGGPNSYKPVKQDLFSEFVAFSKTTTVSCLCADYGQISNAEVCPACNGTGKMEGDADIVIEDLLSAVEDDKQVKKMVKKGYPVVLKLKFANTTVSYIGLASENMIDACLAKYKPASHKRLA